MSDYTEAKDDMKSLKYDIQDALEESDTLDVKRIVQAVESWNMAVEKKEKAVPLTPDKLTVNAPIAFSELSESDQEDWIMEWWFHLEQKERMATHVAESEKELRERHSEKQMGPPDFDYVTDDVFCTFRCEYVNEEAFEAIGCDDVLSDALRKMKTKVARLAREKWEEME